MYLFNRFYSVSQSGRDPSLGSAYQCGECAPPEARSAITRAEQPQLTQRLAGQVLERAAGREMFAEAQRIWLSPSSAHQVKPRRRAGALQPVGKGLPPLDSEG